MKKTLGWIACVLAVVIVLVPVFAQGNRGKAEMSAGGGKIVIDYGRPLNKGRDISKLPEGDYWRMGMNQATTLTTPVDLMFGTTKIAKGSYSLWLLRSAGDKLELVFNTQTGQWGTQHDKSKDVANVAVKKDTASPAAESLTIELKETAKGGTFVLTWGASRLSADFTTGK